MAEGTNIQQWLSDLAADEQRTDSERAAARLLVKSPRLSTPECHPDGVAAWLQDCARQVFVPSASTTLNDEIRVQDEVYAARQLARIANVLVDR
jgi:hypothetical protein